MKTQLLLSLALAFDPRDLFPRNPLLETVLTNTLKRDSALMGEWKVTGETGAACLHALYLPGNRFLCIERPHNNPMIANPHTNGILATEVDLIGTGTLDDWKSTYRTNFVDSNPFCAGHAMFPNGSALIIGGDRGEMINGNVDGYKGKFVSGGGFSRRIYDPCPPGSPASCIGKWTNLPNMTMERWYPSVVTLGDGTFMIIGGQQVSLDLHKLNSSNDNPSYEYWPSRGELKTLNSLVWAYPYNMYPPAFVMPSGKVYLLVSNKTNIIDPKTDSVNTALPDLIADDHEPWLYPFSANMFVLPMTIKNNWKFELMICGGSRKPVTGNNPRRPASPSCYKIAPDDPNPQYVKMPDMPAGRVMPDSVILPDGKVLIVNGMGEGVAGGYAGQPYFAANPQYQAVMFDPEANKWTTLASANLIRSYHSEALLTESGYVITSGTEMLNYNDFYKDNKVQCFQQELLADFAPTNATGCSDPFNIWVERFTPPYLQKGPRPIINNAPSQATHGSLIQVDVGNGNSIARVTFIRTASSTHNINTDQRFVELVIAYHTSSSLFVSLPSNPNQATPGNWFLFVLDANGVPSVAKIVNLQLGPVNNVTVPAGASAGPGTTTNASFSNKSSAKSLIFLLLVLFFNY